MGTKLESCNPALADRLKRQMAQEDAIKGLKGLARKVYDEMVRDAPRIARLPVPTIAFENKTAKQHNAPQIGESELTADLGTLKASLLISNALTLPPKPKMKGFVVTSRIVKQLAKPRVKKKHKSKSYNEEIVVQFFASHGIPKPCFEFQFHKTRKWRFDISWWSPNFKAAVEVDGGIWIRGGHNRGAQMRKDWEKSNEAQIAGWKILRCEPSDLLTADFASLIKRALGVR